ncbi:MAG: membrane protein insertase YidC [Eubacteriales bacterium]
MSLILAPFSWVLGTLNNIFFNYGIAIIIFAVFVKILLFPFSIKGKRGMIQMNMLSGDLARLKKQYGNNQERYNKEVQELYMREKVNPLSGCLWSLLPLFVLIPLYAIIRQPITYILGLSDAQIFELATMVNWDVFAVEYGMVTQDFMTKAIEDNLKDGIIGGFQNVGYNQLFLASLIPEDGIALMESGVFVEPMNFHFFGVDLTKVPNWKIWQDFSVQNLATLFLVAISACTGIISSKVMQKTNKMSNPNQPKNEQMEQTNRMMMWMMPIMSIWIGLIMPSIMVVYWISNNFLSMIQEIFAGQILKKDYEQMRLVQERQAKEQKEDEKRQKEQKVKEIERKKAEQAENKGKNKDKKKKKPQASEEEKLDKTASREGMRAYARGRAYDPNRYPNPNGLGENQTEESDLEREHTED